MKRYIISDTHFYHKNIEKYCNRPIDHNERMIAALSQLKEGDILFHLGDVHFGRREQLKEILDACPAGKVLVRGSHDHWSDAVYLECGFSVVVDALLVKRCLLTHEPVPVPAWADYNIHGHQHNKGFETQDFQDYLRDRVSRGVQENHILYSPEYFNYRPMELQQLISVYRSSYRVKR